MMEIEMSNGIYDKWVDIKNWEEVRNLISEARYDLTGRWRLGGEGKPYDIVNLEL